MNTPVKIHIVIVCFLWMWQCQIKYRMNILTVFRCKISGKYKIYSSGSFIFEILLKISIFFLIFLRTSDIFFLIADTSKERSIARILYPDLNTGRNLPLLFLVSLLIKLPHIRIFRLLIHNIICVYIYFEYLM